MASADVKPPGPRPPDDRSLDRLVDRLASAGRSVGVIRLVERWADQRPPTRHALLAEARAFLDLKLMDRAWVRTRELMDAEGGDVEATALTAEMFIARGWPARAQRLVEHLQAASVEPRRLAAIVEGAAAPPVRPPTNARDLERTGTIEQQIALAESFLVTGSVLRARGLLERLNRTHPDNQRVRHLLWGLRGEFLTGQQTLAELVVELQAGLGGGLAGGLELISASLDQNDPETAEVSKVGALGAMPSEERGQSFPSLFRLVGDAAGGSDEDDDVTVAAVLASTEEMLDPPTAEHADPDGEIASGGGDTQIMQVIGSGAERRLTPASGPMHEKKEKTGGPVDLRQWREKHGFVPTPGLLDAPTMDGLGAYDDDFLEEEDEDVVVMTRTEASADRAPEPAAPRRAPISVIEKIPVPPPVLDIPDDNEDTPTVAEVPEAPPMPAPPRPVAAPVPRPAPPPVEEEPEPEPLPPPPALGLGRVLLLAAAVGAIIASVAAVIGLRTWIGLQQSDGVRQAILDSSPQQLLEARAELRAAYQSGGLLGPPRTHVAARLVLVDLALWDVVTGDPDVLAEARTLAAEGLGGPESRVALAWLDYSEGSLAVPDVDQEGSVGALLAAEVALARGDLDRADAALRAVSGEPSVRLGLARLRLEDARGSVDVANVSSVTRAHPLGQLWLYGGGDASMADRDRLASLAALRDALPPEAGRLIARTWSTEALVHESAGRAEAAAEAWEKALRADQNDPALLARAAVDRRTAGASLKLLRHCLGLRPSDAGCQRGLIQVLLESGDVAAAETSVGAWREAGLGIGVLGDWVSLRQGNRDIRPGTPDARDLARAGAPLVAYLDGLAQGTRSSRVAQLGKAAAELAASESPWDRRLALRVREALQAEDESHLP